MTRVLAPVRYPLTNHSRRTLAQAAELAGESDADLTVLHVNLYHKRGGVTRQQLRRAVEAVVGYLPRARYVVRDGFLVEETILEEATATDADVVVVGRKQFGRWRRAIRRLVGTPDVEGFLRRNVGCELVAVD